MASQKNDGGDDPSKAETRANYVKWTQWLGAYGGTIGVVAEMVYNEMKKGEIRDKIIAALKTLSDVGKGASDEFFTAIKDLDDGKPYDPIPTPDKFPDFPDSGSAENLAKSAWGIAKPVLQWALGKLHPSSPWFKILNGMVNESDRIIDDLSKLFKKS